MKAYRKSNILMVIFFLLVISVPLLFANKVPGKISAAENRALANFPVLRTSNNKINHDFIKQFENWFNDNLGFRDILVKANTLLQYNLFGKLTKSDTMIGKDKWLYYVTSDIVKDYQHLNLPSERQLARWGNSLEQINNYLKEKHIPFIMMLCPDKKTIYPENYPDTILKVGNVSRTDMLQDYVTRNTSIDFFSPKDALLAAKSEATVYSPRFDNAHWNNYGAFIGYVQLMDNVKEYYPDIEALSWGDFDITTYQRELKIYNAIAFTETDYAFNMKKESTAVQTHGKFEGLNLIHSDKCYTYINTNNKLPKAIVFGDSYFYLTLIPYLAESFSEFTFIHAANIDKIDTFVSMFNPDIVIYESAERMLDYIMPIIEKTAETFTDYSFYKNLPVISANFAANKPLMWLDYINNNQVQSQGEILIDRSAKVVKLVGWSLDQKSENTAGNMYVKVGDKYYSGTYGIPRTSVSDYFKNPNLTNSGFTFQINTEELINAGKFSFIIIANDRSYQYTPIEFKVQVR